jgi:hypothetical protein
LSEQEAMQHIEELAKAVQVFCTETDLAAITLSSAQIDEIAERIFGELNDHQGKHREALDHLSKVIDAPLAEDGKRDYRCQLSVIRDALRLLARRLGATKPQFLEPAEVSA